MGYLSGKPTPNEPEKPDPIGDKLMGTKRPGDAAPPPKPANAQCSECGVDEPYPTEIRAGGVLCGGCGRSKPSTLYLLAPPPSDAAPPDALKQFVFHARVALGCWLDGDGKKPCFEQAMEALDDASVKLEKVLPSDAAPVRNDK